MTVANYLRAAGALSKAEAALLDALDRLAAARAAGDPERVTRARLRAQDAARAAEALFEAGFLAHKAHWLAQAQAAERRLAEAVAPLAAEVNALHRLAGSLTPNPARATLENALIESSATFVPRVADVPLEFPDSAALERAETEIFAHQPSWRMPRRKT